MKYLLLLLALLGGLVQAAHPLKTDKHGYPLLMQLSADGFVDCSFSIVDLVETQSSYRFRLLGSYEGETVGMAVTLRKGIKAAMDADMKLIQNHVYRQGVVFSRSGPESDRLVAALAKSYGMKVSPVRMLDDEPFTVIALHQASISMDSDPVKLKLFGRDGPDDSEEEYNESFFNLDLKNKVVFWNEKDQEYRAALIRALSK